MHRMFTCILAAFALLVGFAATASAENYYEGRIGAMPKTALATPIRNGTYRVMSTDDRYADVQVKLTSNRDYTVTGWDDVTKITFYKVKRGYVVALTSPKSSTRRGYVYTSLGKNGAFRALDTAWSAAVLLGRVDRKTGAPDLVTDMPYTSAEKNKDFFDKLSAGGKHRKFDNLMLTVTRIK